MFVVIFVFYCIPKSKRSVYLLPVYPFLAWWVAGYGWHLVKSRQPGHLGFMWTICLTAITAYVAYVVVQCGWFPYSLLHGRHALEQAMMVTSLYNSGVSGTMGVRVAVDHNGSRDLASVART